MWQGAEFSRNKSTIRSISVNGRPVKGVGEIDKFSMREQELMDAAIRLFREKGYYGTSIRDLAEAIGLQKSALYHYVGSKEDLLFRISDETLRESLGILQEILRAPLSNVERLRRAMEHHVLYVATRGTATTVFLRDIHALGKEQRNEILRLARDYRAAWEQILRQGMDAGEFRPGDVTLLTMAILGAANWVAIWFDPAGRLSPEAIANTFVDAFLSGTLLPASSVPAEAADAPHTGFSTEVAVRWADLDMQGTLPLASACAYCEAALDEMLAKHGWSRLRLLRETSSVLALVRSTLDGHGRIGAGTLDIDIGVHLVSDRTVSLGYRLAQDGLTVGRIAAVYEVREAKSGVSMALPQPLHHLFSSWGQHTEEAK